MDGRESGHLPAGQGYGDSLIVPRQDGRCFNLGEVVGHPLAAVRYAAQWRSGNSPAQNSVPITRRGSEPLSSGQAPSTSGLFSWHNVGLGRPDNIPLNCRVASARRCRCWSPFVPAAELSLPTRMSAVSFLWHMRRRTQVFNDLIQVEVVGHRPPDRPRRHCRQQTNGQDESLQDCLIEGAVGVRVGTARNVNPKEAR